MYQLPLFPLNMVLFPGTPIQLHIFEERYKRMIGRCIRSRRPFGVVFAEQSAEALEPLAEPFPVGCSAQIIHVEHLEQGKMNIVAVGRERFRILSIDRRTQPYLLGWVEEYPLTPPSQGEQDSSVRVLRYQLEQFIQMLVQSGGMQFDFGDLPEDPVNLAYMAAAILQTSPAQKQNLLSVEKAEDLFMGLKSAYRRELALLKTVVARKDEEQIGLFSRN